MRFCDRLKELRSDMGISQDKLSKDLKASSGMDISQQRINHYENQNNEPDFDTLVLLADFFHVSVDYIIGHSNIRTPSAEYDLYKLNSTEKEIIDYVRTFPPEYATGLLQLLEITKKM